MVSLRELMRYDLDPQDEEAGHANARHRAACEFGRGLATGKVRVRHADVALIVMYQYPPLPAVEDPGMYAPAAQTVVLYPLEFAHVFHACPVRGDHPADRYYEGSS